VIAVFVYSNRMTAMNKMLTLPALALLMAAAATPAMACPDCADKQAAAASFSPTADALRVVKDPETGQLRAPTAAEIQASDLRAAARSSARTSAVSAAAAPMFRLMPSGARRVRVTEEFQSHTVAVIKADGTVDTQCYERKDPALNALSNAKQANGAVALATE